MDLTAASSSKSLVLKLPIALAAEPREGWIFKSITREGFSLAASPLTSHCGFAAKKVPREQEYRQLRRLLCLYLSFLNNVARVRLVLG